MIFQNIEKKDNFHGTISLYISVTHYFQSAVALPVSCCTSAEWFYNCKTYCNMGVPIFSKTYCNMGVPYFKKPTVIWGSWFLFLQIVVEISQILQSLQSKHLRIQKGCVIFFPLYCVTTKTNNKQTLKIEKIIWRDVLHLDPASPSVNGKDPLK